MDLTLAEPLAATSAVPAVRAPAIVQTAWFLADLDGFLEHGGRRHGDVFSARILGLGSGRLVLVSDPALVEDIYRASPRTARAGLAARDTVAPVAGEHSLLSLDAPRHLEHRRILLPRFHGDRLEAYRGIMAEETRRAVDAWPADRAFSLRPEMARITLAVIMRAIFGLDVSSAHPRAEQIRDALLAMTENDGAFNLALMVPALRRSAGPWRAWDDFLAARARAYALLREEVALRRAAPDLGDRTDILSLLVAARDHDGEGLSDDELLDELVTLLIAAHETTATALSWAFDLLLHHPAALARLRAELREGGDAYLDAVCRETLRVRPVVPLTLRVLTEPLRVGPYELPAGVTAAPCIHLLHRRPDLYPEPAAFRPERFLERRPGTYEWIAFGGGTRRCLGASFAPMEMHVVLREVLGAVELEPVSRRPARVRRRTVFLVPAGGVRVRVRRRPGDAGRG